MSNYSSAVEIQMDRFYQSLNERDRRRYAAVEAVKLGHGGIEFISQLLACDPKTIHRGIAELDSEQMNAGYQRKKGGRTQLTKKCPQLVDNFFIILSNHTAGDPMRHDVKWTNLSRRHISRKLSALGAPANKNIVSQLLHDHGYRRRKPQKSEQWDSMLIAMSSLKILPD